MDNESSQRSNNMLNIGLDWGTHSSKWVRTSRKAPDGLVSADVHPSTLVAISGDFVFSPSDTQLRQATKKVESLKQLIIRDPFQNLWDGVRGDIGTTLGEAVTFSIASLMNKALQGQISGPAERLDVGISLPNWIRAGDDRSSAALNQFHQVVSVAVRLFGKYEEAALPIPGKPFSAETWTEFVREARARPHTGPLETDIDVRQLPQTGFREGRINWSYLVESCAAGLPYLRSLGLSAGILGLLKLLVIDVGAGSTDVGYMIRTHNREERLEHLYYLPPAVTCPIAGNDLTERIQEHERARGNPIPLEDAEATKLRDTGWQDLGFAEEWRRGICKHVKDYVLGIPDTLRLPSQPGLKIVVTGGSGVVPRLTEQVRETVVQGLRERGISGGVSESTELESRRLQGLPFEREAEHARLAVALGVADSDKPSLRFRDELRGVSSAPRIEPRPRWI